MIYLSVSIPILYLLCSHFSGMNLKAMFQNYIFHYVIYKQTDFEQVCTHKAKELLKTGMMVEETPVAEPSHEGRFIAPWAAGESLRKIEKEVIIPNKMKKRAKVICKDYMETFGQCVNGRTLSLAWACGKQRDAMKNCLKTQLDDASLYEECRVEYIQEREEFQHSYVETGKKKNVGRKMPAM